MGSYLGFWIYRDFAWFVCRDSICIGIYRDSTMISFGDRGFWGLNWQHSGDGFIRFVIAKFVDLTAEFMVDWLKLKSNKQNWGVTTLGKMG